MIELVNAFITPVSLGMIDDLSLIKDVEKICYDKQEVQINSGRQLTKEALGEGYGGFQMEFHNKNKTTYCPGIKELPTMKKFCDVVTDRVNETIELMGVKGPRSIGIQSGWFNLNKKGDYAPEHSHVQSHLSAVIFIKGEGKDCGNLVLKDIDVRKEMNSFYLPPIQKDVNNYNNHRYFVVPKPGRFAIFPAHVKHLVEINQTDEDRISIAMDLTIHV